MNHVTFLIDCEQSLSSPNFSEVGELASEARAASREKRGRGEEEEGPISSLSPIPLSFLPLFCIIYSFPLARRI